jgi:hypothetical protein
LKINPCPKRKLSIIQALMVLHNIIKLAKNNPVDKFHSDSYLRHNQRRLEHLASLHLPIHGSKLLEVGAGIGDHTSFFIDRGCKVVSTEARDSNLQILRKRYPDIRVEYLNMEDPKWNDEEKFDVIYCYGLLYHLKKPLEAIKFMSEHCNNLLLLETCVSYGEESEINLCDEKINNPTQSISGFGCRPTRLWIFETLKQFFPFIYIPLTQPSHPEFPLDWTCVPSIEMEKKLIRAVFIASMQELNNPNLITYLPPKQTYQ